MITALRIRRDRVNRLRPNPQTPAFSVRLDSVVPGLISQRKAFRAELGFFPFASAAMQSFLNRFSGPQEIFQGTNVEQATSHYHSARSV